MFLSDRSGSIGLWSIRVDNGKATGSPELVRGNLGGRVYGLGFSRDGAYFYGTDNKLSDIYVVGIDSTALEFDGPPKTLSDRVLGSNFGATWSPDGRFVAFGRRSNPTDATPTLVIRSVNDGTRADGPQSSVTVAESCHLDGFRTAAHCSYRI